MIHNYILLCILKQKYLGGPVKGRGWWEANAERLLGAGVLGDGLGSLGDGVLGELSGQQETDGGLDLPGRDGGALVVVGEAARLGGDALEDVVDERVHDAHGLGRDAGVGVHLLEHLVDVDGVRLLPALPLGLLVRLGDVFLGLARLLGGLSGGFGWHVGAVRWTKGSLMPLLGSAAYIFVGGGVSSEPPSAAIGSEPFNTADMGGIAAHT
jgi:hypothetical protein